MECGDTTCHHKYNCNLRAFARWRSTVLEPTSVATLRTMIQYDVVDTLNNIPWFDLDFWSESTSTNMNTISNEEVVDQGGDDSPWDE
jgi:hypothetical protein